MQDSIYNFWKNHSLANIKPGIGGEFPEGWDVVEFFHNFLKPQEYGTVIEVGCGYGRICTAFDQNRYTGLDISREAIKKAKSLHPKYNFLLLDEDDLASFFPYSKTKILYTVMLHQSDEDIRDIVKNLCVTSKKIIVAEICGRDWRRPGNPPVFNREPEEYIQLFADSGKGSCNIFKKPYERYKDFDKQDTDLSIMVFDD